MEKLKQEAINILMLAKEINQETGATYDNAFKAIEMGRKQLDSDSANSLFEFARQQYLSLPAKQEAEHAKWEAENEKHRELMAIIHKDNGPEGAPIETPIVLAKAKAQ